LDSYAINAKGADLILIEGAGSPAEINLPGPDIANMGFATAAGVPVVMVADIDRGGVIASLVGTHGVVGETVRAQIKGYIINKFRGDISLFDEGLREITDRTGWPGLGVVPYFTEAIHLPAEDAMALDTPISLKATQGTIKIAVPRLSRIANFDDLDPLIAEPDVDVIMVAPGQVIPVDADVILLPGSKATIADLAFLRQQGWDIDILSHYRRGGRILGICGGYQMLGNTISDPEGIEGNVRQADGLGLLDIHTELKREKNLGDYKAVHHQSGEALQGYEIHLGDSRGPDCDNPFLSIDGKPGGARNPNGRVEGCYLHGLMRADGFRQYWLAQLRQGRSSSGVDYDALVDNTLDSLADHLEAHLDLDKLLDIGGTCHDR
jgi:adenosylcobyric acid synthase